MISEWNTRTTKANFKHHLPYMSLQRRGSRTIIDVTN